MTARATPRWGDGPRPTSHERPVMKLAVLNINTIFDESRRGIALTQKLQNSGRDWQQKLQGLEEQRKRLVSQLSQAGAKMAPHQALALQSDVQGVEMELNYLRQRSDTALKAQVQQSQAQIMQEITPLLNDYCREKGISVVFTSPATPILYCQPELDVTTDFIRYYDAKARG